MSSIMSLGEKFASAFIAVNAADTTVFAMASPFENPEAMFFVKSFIAAWNCFRCLQETR